MLAHSRSRVPSLLCSCAALALLLVAGCSPTSPDSVSDTASTIPSEVPSSQPSRGTIGFSALNLKNPFFKIIADTLTEEARKQGFEVVVNDAGSDVKTQSQHVDDYIARKVTAIVLNPADREAIGAAIRRANEAQIPVFTCDLQCEAEGIDVAGHIGTNNFQGGELAGQAMIEALGARGGDVLILHLKQANSCVERVNGFRKVIDAHNAGSEFKINLVSELDGAGLQDPSYKATSDALQTHPNLAGIFAINDPSALGAWTALKQAGKTDQVVIVGFDGQLEGKQAILEGKIYADPIQFPRQMATGTLDKIVKYLDGEDFERVELIPTQLYRKADAEQDPELRANH